MKNRSMELRFRDARIPEIEGEEEQVVRAKRYLPTDDEDVTIKENLNDEQMEEIKKQIEQIRDLEMEIIELREQLEKKEDASTRQEAQISEKDKLIGELEQKVE